MARVRREVDRLAGLVSTLIEMTSAEGDPTTQKCSMCQYPNWWLRLSKILPSSGKNTHKVGIEAVLDFPSLIERYSFIVVKLKPGISGRDLR